MYILLFLYLRHSTFRNPTSFFFDPARGYERLYTTQRIAEAEAFLATVWDVPVSGHEVGVVGWDKDGKVPKICIGIATVRRREEQYVQHTVGSLLQGLSEEERKGIHLNVLLAHNDDSVHPFSNEKWMRTLPDKVLAYKEADLAQLKEWEDAGWYRNKSIFDYTYLLQDCYDSGAAYVIMLEDDTLVREGWYARVTQALQNIEREMSLRTQNENRHGKGNKGEWIYLRLFYMESLLGWNSEMWPVYLFYSIAIWMLTSIFLIILRLRSRTIQNTFSTSSLIRLSTICSSALIILYFLAGPSNLFSHLSISRWPGVYEMNKYGCCSQALVFPRDIVPKVLGKADLETDWLVDMMLERIADSEGWERWVLVPALVQHVGE